MLPGVVPRGPRVTQTNCPSCAGPLTFQASHSLLAVCDYCRSTVIRRDLDLEVIGKMSEVREDHTPLRVGATGSFQGTGFRVIGRLQARFDGGSWNEWYLMMADGSTAWLGESNGRISFLTEQPPAGGVPPFDALRVGSSVSLAIGPMQVVEKRVAKVVGAEGELPFQVLGGYKLPFADLSDEKGRFGTLDYSDGPNPRVYVGPFVPLRELKMSGLRRFPGFDGQARTVEGEPADVEAESFSCPSCAAPISVHVPGQTQRIGCGSCGSLLDLQDERLKLIETWKEKVQLPDIPIGSMGQLDGITWEVLGVIRKAVKDVYFEYPWLEYLLFNPYEGYRWLVQSDGHFTFLEPCAGVPVREGSTGRRYRGVSYREFQTGEAHVKHVLGEMYWQVLIGQVVSTADYIAPPAMLSREGDGVEQVWSVGAYRPGAEIWEGFKLPGEPPSPLGVAPNQPFDPDGRFKGIYRSFAWLVAALILVTAGQWALARKEPLGNLTGQLNSGANVVVSKPFTLEGRPAAMEIESSASLNNQWIYLDVTLINQDSGKVVHTGQMLEKWSGPDWSEGDGRATSIVGPVPAGEWVMKVSPMGDPASTAHIAWGVKLTWDVPRLAPSLLALLFLALGPLILKVKEVSFENRRWNQE